MTVNPDFLRPPTSATNTATTNGVSTAAIDLWGGVTQTPAYYVFAVKGADVHILFGTSAVAAATTSSAAYVPAGATLPPVWIDASTRYFTAIATSVAAGQAVSWWRAS